MKEKSLEVCQLDVSTRNYQILAERYTETTLCRRSLYFEILYCRGLEYLTVDFFLKFWRIFAIIIHIDYIIHLSKDFQIT